MGVLFTDLYLLFKLFNYSYTIYKWIILVLIAFLSLAHFNFTMIISYTVFINTYFSRKHFGLKMFDYFSFRFSLLCSTLLTFPFGFTANCLYFASGFFWSIRDTAIALATLCKSKNYSIALYLRMNILVKSLQNSWVISI